MELFPVVLVARVHSDHLRRLQMIADLIVHVDDPFYKRCVIFVFVFEVVFYCETQRKVASFQIEGRFLCQVPIIHFVYFLLGVDFEPELQELAGNQYEHNQIEEYATSNAQGGMQSLTAFKVEAVHGRGEVIQLVQPLQLFFAIPHLLVLLLQSETRILFFQ